MRRLVLSLLAVSFMLTAAPALADYPTDCLGLDTPSGTDCGDINTIGCCDDTNRVVWCDGGSLYCIDCPSGDKTCGWSVDAGFYDCSDTATEDPSGENPISCVAAPDTCGDATCQDGAGGETCANCPEDCGCTGDDVCHAGVCCTPSCDGKVCGDDGCGGSCGTCDTGMVCSDEFACVPPEETCSSVQDVVCDDVLEGDNTDGSNVIASACGSWETAGPEVIYAFTATVDDTLMLTMEETGGVDHDLGLMENYCTEVACLGSGDTGMNMEVTAGKTYYIVVDGYTAEDIGTFTLTVGCQSTCVPQCEGKQCGDDGCGGTCGETECTGFCVEGVCYADGGCGVSGDAGCGGCDCEACVCELDPFCCGNDDAGEGTWDEYCQYSCLNDCGGCGLAANCGDGSCLGAENCNNCGADCGCTGDGEVCTAAGECCVPNCDGKVCGDDGCGGSCGTCDAGLACNAEGQCVEAMLAECKGLNEPSGADCMGLTETGCCDSLGRTLWCQDGALYCIDCAANNPSCGWSADAGWYDCGTDGSEDPTGANPYACESMTCDPACEAGYKCVDGECVVCTPDCAGKTCGNDGCGGSCGTCDAGSSCNASGQCVSDSDQCLGFGEPSAADCGDVSEAGCCDAGRLYYCYEGALYCADCGGTGNPSCGWNAENMYYDCGTDGSGDPTGVNPLECPTMTCTPDCAGKTCGDDGCGGNCGTCDAGMACQEGACVACEASCGGMECGDDGCGGTCGICAAGFSCEAGQCVEEGTCTPDCGGKTCGDDGCGGSCGTCNAGFTCTLGQCVEGTVDTDVISGDDTVDPGTGTDSGGGSSCSTSTTGHPSTLVLFGLMLLGLAVLRRTSYTRG